MKTLEECRQELNTIKGQIEAQIAVILDEKINEISKKLQQETMRICEENNLKYINMDDYEDDVDGAEEEFEEDLKDRNSILRKRGKPEITKQELAMEFLECDVATFVSNTFIQSALKQDPCADWDGYVRCKNFQNNLISN